MQCTFPNMQWSFMVIECLHIHIFTLSQNITYYWWIYILLCTRVNTLNEISTYSIHTYEYNHHIIFLSFQTCLECFPCPTNILTRSLFMFDWFISAHTSSVHDFQFLCINWSNNRLIFLLTFSIVSLTCFVLLTSDLTLLVCSQTFFLILISLEICLIRKN